MKSTIYEIAQEAKVSIATVSRALNPATREKVSPETLKRVDEVVRRRHYAPSFAARGLTRSIFNTIGIVVPHGEGFFLNEYYSTILCGVADELLETKYRFKLLMLKCAGQKWDRYDFRSAEGVDGLIVTHWHAVFSDASVFKKIKIPAVVIGDPEKNVSAHFVSADQRLGGELAAKYLCGRGHRKFAVMTGSLGSIDSQLRLEGFRAVLEKKGVALPKDRILCGEFQEEPAARAAGEFFKSKPDVTAIFCVNDTMAYGVIRKMKALGLRCPEDISIVGFDDDSRAAAFEPPLTTVKVPLYRVARKAAAKLVGRLSDEKTGKRFAGLAELLPVELVERRSVRERK